MTSRPGDRPTPERRRRRRPILLAIVIVVAVATTVTVTLRWLNDGDTAGPRPRWAPPPQTVLESSMATRPVSGWTLRAGELGLPEGSRFSTGDDPAWSSALIGSRDDRAYFLASSSISPSRQWWLVGVNAASGMRLFEPVGLDVGPVAPQCFLNGPAAVLCLQDGDALVIDSQSGAVRFRGPTDLRSSPGQLGVIQLGQYAVAATQDRGVYGIGPRAETTWFVPGDGSIRRGSPRITDAEPQTLAIQDGGGDEMVIFSVVDGSVVEPAVAAGVRTFSAAVYPGGFAVEVARDETSSLPQGVEFFDSTNRRVGEASGSAFLAPGPADLPIIESAPSSKVYSPSGDKLADISRFGPGDNAVLIGHRLFVDGASVDGPAEQWDLQTGERGKDCNVFLGGYLGTDGKVGVFESGNPNVGLVTKGIDLVTCDAVWQIESPVGSFRDVWRVGTTLVQSSDEGTELTSLVAPS